MKKLLFIVSLCLLLTPVFTFASIDNNLYYGLQQNSDVKQLQEFLTDKGFFTGNATGNFFSLTLKAVKAYQTSAGIISTGYVGALTRTAVNNELAVQLSASNAQAATETGTTPPAPIPQATTNDVVSNLQAQIALLMQQLTAMQAQQTTVQQLQQTVQQQTQTIQQIQQNTQQIAQNTTPQSQACNPNWQCVAWSDCTGTQTRTCADSNNCGTTTGKPVLTQTCTSTSVNVNSVVPPPSVALPSKISAGSTNTKIGSFTFFGNGQNVKITSLQVLPVLTGTTPAPAGLSNVRLFFEGVQIGIEQNWNGASNLVYQLGSQMIIQAGRQSTLEVRADITQPEGTPYTAGSVSVTLPAGTSNGQDMSSQKTIGVPSSSVSGNSSEIVNGAN